MDFIIIISSPNFIFLDTYRRTRQWEFLLLIQDGTLLGCFHRSQFFTIFGRRIYPKFNVLVGINNDQEDTKVIKK